MTTWGAALKTLLFERVRKQILKKNWTIMKIKTTLCSSWDCAQTQKAIRYISWFNDWTILFHEIIFENILRKNVNFNFYAMTKKYHIEGWRRKYFVQPIANVVNLNYVQYWRLIKMPSIKLSNLTVLFLRTFYDINRYKNIVLTKHND
jgi:hypothetical protein